jgi:hypothetical protein
LRGWTHGSPSKYSPQVRERFVRLVQEHSAEHSSQWAAIAAIAPKAGCTTRATVSACSPGTFRPELAATPSHQRRRWRIETVWVVADSLTRTSSSVPGPTLSTQPSLPEQVEPGASRLVSHADRSTASTGRRNSPATAHVPGIALAASSRPAPRACARGRRDSAADLAPARNARTTAHGVGDSARRPTARHAPTRASLRHRSPPGRGLSTDWSSPGRSWSRPRGGSSLPVGQRAPRPTAAGRRARSSPLRRPPAFAPGSRGPRPGFRFQQPGYDFGSICCEAQARSHTAQS